MQYVHANVAIYKDNNMHKCYNKQKCKKINSKISKKRT